MTRVAIVPGEDEAEQRGEMQRAEPAVAAPEPHERQHQREQAHVAAELPPFETGDLEPPDAILERDDERRHDLRDRRDDRIVRRLDAREAGDEDDREHDAREAQAERRARHQRRLPPGVPRPKGADELRSTIGATIVNPMMIE